VPDHVAGVLFGLDTRTGLRRLPPQPEDGPRIIEDDGWMFTGMVGLGVNANPPSDRAVSALVHGRAGILRRLGDAFESRLGLVAAFYLPEGVGGPAVLFDVFDVAAIQAGWMIDAGLLVSVEVTGAFICDLFC
jgi:hypothetical protein